MRDEALVDEESSSVEEASQTWYGEPVFVYTGKPSEVVTHLPTFERRGFGIAQSENRELSSPREHFSGENRFWDVVVRVPIEKGERNTPVGIVSKRYSLVQHRDLFEQTCVAIEKVGIDLSHVVAELTLTLYGSRMRLTFGFPEHFDFDPGDGHKLKLQLHCINSVDARTRLRIVLGWLRLVCGNGLVVGTAQLSQMFVHNEYLQLPDIGAVLGEGLELAKEEKALFTAWIKKPVASPSLTKWVDTAVREKWGPLAGARVLHICRTGFDGKFANPGEKAPPSRKQMKQTVGVPGAPSCAENAYFVCQALAWVARTRKDIQDQLDGMRDLPNLMQALLT